MKRVFVAGYKGFIGGHLWKELENKHYREGWDILGNDYEDINRLQVEDLKDVDTVFHLAAMPRVPFSIDYPSFTNYHNVQGTVRLFAVARRAGVRRIVFSSSSSVYGDQDKLPLTEDMEPNPLSPYGLQKLIGEWYARMFSELYDMDIVCLRYFNVYGEGMTADNAYAPAIAIFKQQKALRKPLTVFGGEQKRDFTYVGDVVRANILAMESPNRFRGEGINIGAGKNYSIKEIAEKISDNIEYLPQRKGEAMETLADLTLAKKLLNYKPTKDLMDWLPSLSLKVI